MTDVDMSGCADILCCLCGLPTPPNSSATCATCLASGSDITRGISTEVTLHQCRSCQRWHKEEAKWLGCDIESRELMGLCLEKTAGLKSKRGDPTPVKLTDASWIWTEPHSMRLKVKLTVQREVQTGLILQQSFVTTYVVRNQQCSACLANFTQGAWVHLVQVRQKVGHKRTFLYLEQVILKKGAAKGALNIEVFSDGMDFYFGERNKGERFIDFLESEVPLKTKRTKKLIGTDTKSNICNYKHTSFVEIVPLCKDDMLFLPKGLARAQSQIARTVILKSVGAVMSVVDPITGQSGTVTSQNFWNEPFRPLITANRSVLTRFVVLNKEASANDMKVGQRITKKRLNRRADLTVMREADMGVSDEQFIVSSHLGYLCRAGDVVLGYHLEDTNITDDEASRLVQDGKAPQLVIVRKLYGSAASGSKDSAKKRLWKLERLAVEQKEGLKMKKKEQDQMEDDEEDFLREVDANKDMRENMNLYKADEVKVKADEGMGVEGDDEEMNPHDDQAVKLDELLDGLDLATGPDGKVDGAMPVAGVDYEYDEDKMWGGAPIGEVMTEEGAKAREDGLGFFDRDEANDVEDKSQPTKVTQFGDQFLSKGFKFT